MVWKHFVAGLACFLAVGSVASASKTVTATTTITVTKTKGHVKTTVTTTELGSDVALIYGDVTENGLPFPTDVYTTIRTTTTVIASSTSTLTETPVTVVPGLATRTLQAIGANIRDTLPEATYYYKEGGPDPVGKLKKREADATRPPLAIRKATTTTSTCTTTTKVKSTITKTSTTTFTGTYITWSDESSGMPLSDYTTPIYTSSTTKLVHTTETWFVTFVTSTASTTSTALASTTTVYGSCATDNFADAIVLSDGSYAQIIMPVASIQTTIPGVTSAYDCCAQNINYFGGAWVYGSDIGCISYQNDDTYLCKENTRQYSNFTVLYGASDLHHIVGNGECGAINAAVQRT